MNLLRVFADGAGETHLARIELPDPVKSDDGLGAPMRRTIQDIPTTTLSINENLGRRPRLDLHPAPRRQLVILLQGAFEITTTAGDSYRFQPGDCLLAEDVDGKGHTHQDVGEQPTITIAVGVPTDWKFPGT